MRSNASAMCLTNARVHSPSVAGGMAEAILLERGKITAIGSAESCLAQSREIANTLDLDGRTVLPGLIDAHTHLEGTACHLTYFADCHAPPHRRIADILTALSDHARAHPDEPWVIGQGSFMLAEKLEERRFPTLPELDAAVPDRPALIRAGAHISVVNSAALREIGIDKNYTPPPGGHVDRDDQGNPTGVLIELAWHLGLPPFSLAQTLEAVGQTAALLSRYGVTSLQDQFPSATGLRAYQQLQEEDRLPLRITFTIHCPNLAAVHAFLDKGFPSGFDGDWLKPGAVKFFVDGGITGAAAAFYDDYAHQLGNRGQLKIERAECFEMVRVLDGAGIQISTHVVGDRALDMLLDAYSAIPNPSGKRHRLEHAGHLCMTADRIDRIKTLGLIPVVTMPFLSSFGDFLPEYLGDRAAGAFALRRLLDAGVIVPGSSDSLGAQPESLSPWFGIWCSVARQTYRGATLAPEEAVSVSEALATYTTSAAYVDFEESIRGALSVGMLADLIVCDRDPTKLPISELQTFAPSATILNGRLVSGTLPGSV